MNHVIRHTKRVIVGVVGATILIFGIALLVLPGPGLLLILIGLIVLATEFIWAERLLGKARVHYDKAKLDVQNGRHFWRNSRLLLGAQLLALVAGSIIGWTTVASEVQNYCTTNGTNVLGLINTSGSLSSNPLLAPCFWGSIAFVVALVWTVFTLFESKVSKLKVSLQRLWWLLLGATIFALVNNVPIFWRYLQAPAKPLIACNKNAAVSSPFLTSCFGGLVCFALALACASMVLYLIKQYKNKPAK